MLKHISYVSEQSHSLSENDIEELLKKSRSQNLAKNITGILIYFEGVFTQFVEGPELAIDDLYKKITQDRRHKNLRALFSGTTTDRYYGEWSMAYKSTDEIKALKIPGYFPFDKTKFFEPVNENKEHPGIMLLESFVDGLHFF